MSQHTPRTVSAAAAEYAISVAQLKRILGRELSAQLELRLADEADLHLFDEELAKNYFWAEKKTQAISLVIARKGTRGAPVFMMVAAKSSSRKSSIAIRSAGYTGKLKSGALARLYFLCLATVVHYAVLTNTKEVQVRRIDSSRAVFLEEAGFMVRKEGLYRHASLYVEHPPHHVH